MKVLIALINNRETLPTKFVGSLIALMNYTRKYIEIGMVMSSATYIDQMRNSAGQYAIVNKFDYTFFVDTDMVYPKDSIIKLLERKKDIIGGLYYMRKAPHKPCHWKNVQMDLVNPDNFIVPSNRLIKVGATGFGGVLVKTSVFERLKFPYFEQRYVGDNCIGEDIDFAFTCKKEGLKIWIDQKVKYIHLHEMAIVGENQFKEII